MRPLLRRFLQDHTEKVQTFALQGLSHCGDLTFMDKYHEKLSSLIEVKWLKYHMRHFPIDLHSRMCPEQAAGSDP